MRREIRFRGKAIRDYPEHNIEKGDWVYGYFIGASGECGIAVTEGLDYIFGGVTVTKVDCKTVGEFTNFEDDYKKKIYDGDIVQTENGKRRIFKRLGCWFISLERELGYYNKPLKVIGNAYDNPELLKEVNND